MNLKKLLIISIIALFTIGIMAGSVDAAHTFKKGGYTVKISNKEYNKIKNDPESMYYTAKKVKNGKSKYWYKTYKMNTWREYYNKNGKYQGDKYFIHANGIYNNKYYDKKVKDISKVVKHVNKDGSYYVDYIDYDKYRFKKTVTPTKYMVIYKAGGKVKAKIMNDWSGHGINM